MTIWSPLPYVLLAITPFIVGMGRLRPFFFFFTIHPHFNLGMVTRPTTGGGIKNQHPWCQRHTRTRTIRIWNTSRSNVNAIGIKHRSGKTTVSISTDIEGIIRTTRGRRTTRHRANGMQPKVRCVVRNRNNYFVIGWYSDMSVCKIDQNHRCETMVTDMVFLAIPSAHITATKCRRRCGSIWYFEGLSDRT